MYDLAVVGLGLIGSGALRHAARNASVVGIGPAEPVVWNEHNGPFASHYDSGRITRRLDARSEWAILASRAIDEYPEIERDSGVSFHRSSGLVFVRRDPDGIQNLTDVAARLNIGLQIDPVETPYEQFPELSFPVGYTRLAEPGPAGAIDPRRMITAQHLAAQNAGATIDRDVVASIEAAASGYEVRTGGGAVHKAERVLVATGAYTNSLLGRWLDEPLAMAVRPEVIAMGRISEAEAERLTAMPSIIYLLDHPELDDVYIVPPALYPDGHWYIKIGGSHRLAGIFDDDATMNEWMSPGTADQHMDALRGVLIDVLPEVDFVAWRTRPCLISDTTTGLPYIDTIAPGLTVAVGGNGHAAKSADAIGALGAGLALNDHWVDDQLPASDFAVHYGRYVPPEGSRHGN